ncbi:MAG: hypothetical protein AB1505_28530 [Candidatus Latescibacterota bacterium]
MVRSAILVSVLFSACAILLGTRRVAAQHPSRHKPPLQTEERLRDHLRKLDRWDLIQLLRTERDVDEQQKQRARASTDPEELALLAGDEDSGVRFAVGVNPYTSVEVLLRLSGDASAAVRAGVALKLSHDVLAAPQTQELCRQIARQLAADPHALVRLALAGNTGLPPETYDLLAQDTDPVIRGKLAANANVGETALRQLAEDGVPAVQLAALQHRSTPADVLEASSADPRSAVRLAVCQNANTPPSVLEKLAGDPDVGVRRAVAAHPATPVQALRRMALDSQVDVVVAVANHPGADRALLIDLVDDPRDAAIRMAAQAALLPLLRAEIREDVLERWQAP